MGSCRQVLVDPVEEERYGRMVAEVWSDAVGLINSELVGQGMAFVYDQYVGGCPSREKIEVVEEAQKPWEWQRQSKRNK